MKLLLLLITLATADLAFSQSYKKLHNKAIVVDTHNDVLSTVTLKGMNIEEDLTGKAHSDLKRFASGGVDVQIFSIFCDEREQTPFQFALREMDSLDAITKRNPGSIVLVNNYRELYKAIKQKKLAAMKGVEGGHMIENSLDKLDSLYQRGARYMTLTWNNSTQWASSAKDETAPEKATNSMSRPHKGLNDFGRAVVKRMNELGMMVDLSHVGEQTFWDAIAVTTKPVIVSHSCVYNLCPHRRNLKDEQIIAVGKKGGVIHLNFYSGFLDSGYDRRRQAFIDSYRMEADSLLHAKMADYEIGDYLMREHKAEAEALRPPLSLLLDHLDYIVKLIGVNHVGLGSDFDGVESTPQQLNGVEDFPLITKALLERGYKKKDIAKILGGNFLRVLRANEQ